MTPLKVPKVIYSSYTTATTIHYLVKISDFVVHDRESKNVSEAL